MADKIGGVIDLGRTLGRARNRISKVGVELEGGWEKPSREVRDLIHHDGSVKVPPPQWPDALEAEYRILLDRVRFGRASTVDVARYESLHLQRAGNSNTIKTGEIATPEPLLPSKVPPYWDGVTKWVATHYPTHVNDTCGLHTHMSFKSNLHYSRLMTPDYPLTLIEYLKRWCEVNKIDKGHPIWPRLKGENTYCQHVYHAGKQVAVRDKPPGNPEDRRRDGHRYTAVNYCYGLHQTVEVRVLSMLDSAELSSNLLIETYRVTNAFLLTVARREETYSIDLVADPDDQLNEEFIEMV